MHFSHSGAHATQRCPGKKMDCGVRGKEGASSETYFETLIIIETYRGPKTTPPPKKNNKQTNKQTSQKTK
jgi:hypothetical protein